MEQVGVLSDCRLLHSAGYLAVKIRSRRGQHDANGVESEEEDRQTETQAFVQYLLFFFCLPPPPRWPNDSEELHCVMSPTCVRPPNYQLETRRLREDAEKTNC